MSDQDQPERAIRMRRNHQLTRDRVPIHGDPGVTDIALGSTPTGELLLGLGPSDGLCPRARGPSSFARDGTRGARLIEHPNEIFDEDGVPDDTDAGTKRTRWHRPDQSYCDLRLGLCHRCLSSLDST